MKMKKRLKTDYIVVHCSATPPNMDVGVKEIDEWHKTRGFTKVGYHDIIRRSGELEFGRDVNEVGAHVAGYNENSVGICLVGGVDKHQNPENNFTPAQFKTLRRSLQFYKALFPAAEILGHTDLFSGKACPSFNVKEWLKENPI